MDILADMQDRHAEEETAAIQCVAGTTEIWNVFCQRRRKEKVDEMLKDAR